VLWFSWSLLLCCLTVIALYSLCPESAEEKVPGWRIYFNYLCVAA
jgi:hypothetical protein